jgi:hypothetical protein
LQCCDGGENGDYNSADAGSDDRGDDSDDGVKMLIVKVL